MTKEEYQKRIQDHLENQDLECRWCFAVDMQSVKTEAIAQHSFPDAMVLHRRCPRCGGECSYYSPGWGELYLKNIISRLHPELKGKIGNELFEDTNDRVFPEYLDP
jgi:hypothetical protein